MTTSKVLSQSLMKSASPNKVVYSFYFKLVGIAFSFIGGDWVLKILGPRSPHFGAPKSAYDRYNA